MQFNNTTGLSKGQHLSDEIKRGTAVQKKLINGEALFLEAYYAETGQISYDLYREASKPR